MNILNFGFDLKKKRKFFKIKFFLFYIIFMMILKPLPTMPIIWATVGLMREISARQPLVADTPTQEQ
jgi:hypothetical protein